MLVKASPRANSSEAFTVRCTSLVVYIDQPSPRGLHALRRIVSCDIVIGKLIDQRFKPSTHSITDRASGIVSTFTLMVDRPRDNHGRRWQPDNVQTLWWSGLPEYQPCTGGQHLVSDIISTHWPRATDTNFVRYAINLGTGEFQRHKLLAGLEMSSKGHS